MDERQSLIHDPELLKSNAPLRGGLPSVARGSACGPLHRGFPDFRQAARTLRRPAEKAAAAASRHPPDIPSARAGAGGVRICHRESCQTAPIFFGLGDTYLRRAMAQTVRVKKARLQSMASSSLHSRLGFSRIKL